MVLSKEYRICMPLTCDEVGQLYTIARHSLEQSGGGEGVEIIANEEFDDEIHGKGQYTEKRLHLSHRLPTWMQAVCPRVFYVTEKSWNFYPYTKTEYTCSFVPKFCIVIETRFEDNNGSSENALNLTEEQLKNRIVDYIDIAYDDLSNKRQYRKSEDPKFFKSEKTNRGYLLEGWRHTEQPIMCSYKLVNVSFEIWGLQTRIEEYIHRTIRDILLLGHRQAFAWVDDWYDMTLEEVREYEREIHQITNLKLNRGSSFTIDKDAIRNGRFITQPKDVPTTKDTPVETVNN